MKRLWYSSDLYCRSIKYKRFISDLTFKYDDREPPVRKKRYYSLLEDIYWEEGRLISPSKSWKKLSKRKRQYLRHRKG